MTEVEKRIDLYMKKLGLTHDEAVKLLVDDKKVDQMKRLAEVDSDLTPEQKATIKKMKNSDTKKKAPTVYKFDNKKPKKIDGTKAGIITSLAEFMGQRVDSLEVTNEQREIAFTLNGENYTLTLVKKRK